MVTIYDGIQWNQLLNRFQAERKNFSNELNVTRWSCHRNHQF